MTSFDTYMKMNKAMLEGQIIFAGSSLMEEFPVEDLFLEKGITVYNRGISGSTSEEYRTMFDQLVIALKPKQIFINIGSNDLSDKNFNSECLEENYQMIFEKVKQSLPQCKVVFIKFYPVNSELIKETACLRKEEWLFKSALYRTNDLLDEASTKISQLASSYNYETLDVNYKLVDENNNLKKPFTTDGIHLTQDGYQQIFPEIYKKVLF